MGVRPRHLTTPRSAQAGLKLSEARQSPADYGVLSRIHDAAAEEDYSAYYWRRECGGGAGAAAAGSILKGVPRPGWGGSDRLCPARAGGTAGV